LTNFYSIKDLERITGIKAHTIRIWEKRYNIVEPERTDSNIRHYSDANLKRIMNVSILVNNGHKISKVASLNEPELSEMILELNTLCSPGRSGQIESLVIAMIELDEVKFEKILNFSIIKTGFEDTLFNVIYPLLNKIGVLWQIGSIKPSHEHFISNLIRQKLYAAIDALAPDRTANNKSFLLVLPEWELHDIGLLVYNFLIRKKGHNSIFLGQGVPLEDVAAVKENIRPDVLVTSFSSSVLIEEMIEYLRELSNLFPGKPIYVGGIQLHKLCSNLPSNIYKVPNALDFRNEVLSKL
jgi:DNA-binding transcriptional MerR regulator